MANETIKFGPSFNVITGESGSGKSILIDCIDMLLGARAQKSMIGMNQDSLFIEGIFSDIGNSVKNKIELLGIPVEDNQLIISREINSKNSMSRINGRAVTLRHIREIRSDLFDLHSQNDHQSLLSKERYIDMIDRYGKDTQPLLALLKSQINKEEALMEEINSLPQSDSERIRMMDLLRFQIQELESIDLYNIDENSLEEELSRLTHTKEILDGLNQIKEILEPSDYASEGTLDNLRSSSHLLEGLALYDKELENISERFKDILEQTIDLSFEISSAADSIQPDDERLFEINSLLDAIMRLKRKYGPELENVRLFYENACSNLQLIENYENRKTNLEEDLKQIQNEIIHTCNELSRERHKIADDLTSQMMDSFHQLEMFETLFEIQIISKSNWDQTGLDDIEFMLSTNAGEPLKPLSKVASGGELSRIMLAFKSVIADVDEIPTMIFDEIDTGLSGKAARIVGQKIQYIARTHQVIAVSHLSQIASLADTHLLVYKSTNQNQTVSHVKLLDHSKRIEEIARLIGGKKLTETTMKNAAELIEQVRDL